MAVADDRALLGHRRAWQQMERSNGDMLSAIERLAGVRSGVGMCVELARRCLMASLLVLTAVEAESRGAGQTVWRWMDEWPAWIARAVLLTIELPKGSTLVHVRQ